MFLSVREIRGAGGRFALIGSVTVLITLLIVMLTGLTNGLGRQNTGALESLAPDRVVFMAPTEVAEPEISFSNSSVSLTEWNTWRDVEGITQVQPLGAMQSRIESGSAAHPAAVLGLPENAVIPGGVISYGAALPASLAEDLAVGVGDEITIGGQEVSVSAVLADSDNASDNYYAHSPVVWVDTTTWQEISHTDAVGTVLLVRADVGIWGGEDIAQATRQTNAIVTDLPDSFKGLAAYSSEQGSLQAMQGFLYGISALVTIAFLSVWTLQRSRDIAILRAMGASKRYVLIDALTQSAIILLLGASIGAGLAWALGSVISGTGTVPVAFDAATVVLPAVGVCVLGIVGSLVAVRTVTKVDPLEALNATQ